MQVRRIPYNRNKPTGKSLQKPSPYRIIHSPPFKKSKKLY